MNSSIVVGVLSSCIHNTPRTHGVKRVFYAHCPRLRGEGIRKRRERARPSRTARSGGGEMF